VAKLLILAVALAFVLQWRVTLCLAALVALWLGARHYVDRKRKWFTVGGPKQLLDAMRKADILADDNAQVLRLLPVEFRVDKQRPRTEVFVREWRE